MNDNCYGLLGLLFGHNFQPRVNTKYIKADNKASELASTLKEYMSGNVVYPADIDAITDGFCDNPQIESVTYIHDMCTRCGEVITKDE